MPHVPLEDALKLVYLYAEKESPKYERAALRWLLRYLEEKDPTLKNFAKEVRSLEARELDAGRTDITSSPRLAEALLDRLPRPVQRLSHLPPSSALLPSFLDGGAFDLFQDVLHLS